VRRPGILVRFLLVGTLLAAGVVSGVVGAGVQSCGPTWSVESSPNAPGSNFLFGTVAISSTDAWAVGEALRKQSLGDVSTSAPVAMHWNGTSWAIVPVPSGNPFENALYGVAALASNDVWTVGRYRSDQTAPNQTLAEHWNGTAWTIVSTPNVGSGDNVLEDVVAISPTAVWAVGHYDDGTGQHKTLVERWNGTAWSVVSSPNLGTSSNWLYGVAASAAKNVWAVGSYYNPTVHALQTLVLRWNGAAWSLVPSPNSGTGINNLLVGAGGVTSTGAWAVGYSMGTSGLTALTERWNGTAWVVVPAAVVGTSNTRLLSVSARNTTDVWAVGSQSLGAASETTLIEQWDGVSWKVVSSPNPLTKDRILTSVSALSTGEAWSVGYGNDLGLQLSITEHICEP
jgi:hypothetical protein